MKILLFISTLFLLVQCSDDNSKTKGDIKWLSENPPMLKSPVYNLNSKPTLITSATVMTATGKTYQKANIYMENGLIKKISESPIQVPNETLTIDGTGTFVTPGLIDVHSHMGVYPQPGINAHDDGNEASRPVTSDVWAEHSFWPQDPSLWRALAGGITTIQVLPGSANLIGGRSFTAKLIPNKLSAREMRFDGAPQGLKMACGENPKRVYHDKGLQTRMGNVAGYRKAFQEALEYARTLKSSKGGEDTKVPKRNFVSETLAQVLSGEMLLHFHCYRADDISAILDVAQEFGFKIRTIQHGLEAYKIAPRLAKEGVGVATWADWWGFKAEAFDGIPQNAALIHRAGGKAIIHSDSPNDVRFLNIEAAKAMVSGRKLGMKISEEEALQWITKNAAWALGIEDKVGTLEEGKMADLVIWDGHPFSVYTKTKNIFINGHMIFDRKNKIRPQSDFEIGFNNGSFFDGRDFNSSPTVSKINTPLKPIYPKDPNPSSSTLIENVNVFLDGQWVSHKKIHFTDDKISTVLDKDTKNPVATVIDAKGAYLTAGLISSSTPLGLVDIEMERSAQDVRSEGGLFNPDNNVIDSLNLRNIRIPIIRQQGVATAISRPQGGMIAGQALAFDLKADNTFYKSPIAMFGSVSKSSMGKLSRSMALSKFKLLFEDAIFYKNNTTLYNAGSSRQLSADARNLRALRPVLDGQIPFVLRAERADEIERAISLSKELKTFGVKLRLVIEGGTESWLVAKQLALKKIPVMLQPTHQTPQSFSKLRARFDLAAFLEKEGVPIIITDDGEYGSSRLRQEAGVAVKYGLSKNAALKAITETPSEVFGLERGKIAKDRPANLVLWSGDPLEPTSYVQEMWILGKHDKAINRQTRLAQKYLEKQIQDSRSLTQ